MKPNAKFSGLSVAKLRWNVELGLAVKFAGVRKLTPAYALHGLKCWGSCLTPTYRAYEA